ncbi:MAG: hypothetical protein IAG10_22315 [Planctomycetaceae bacterium]|nr:hypothetical protein [Planctomycetaceae bacterium]
MTPIGTDAFRDALEKLRALHADIELFADGDVRQLSFVGTSVEDADLATVAMFSRLQRLYLGATRVTDAGMKFLVGLKNLEYLSLHGTEVSELRRQQLRLLLPNCRVCPRSDPTTPTPPVIVAPSVPTLPNVVSSASDATLPREILRRIQTLETDVNTLRQLIEQQFPNPRGDS